MKLNGLMNTINIIVLFLRLKIPDKIKIIRKDPYDLSSVKIIYPTKGKLR